MLQEHRSRKVRGQGTEIQSGLEPSDKYRKEEDGIQSSVPRATLKETQNVLTPVIKAW